MRIIFVVMVFVLAACSSGGRPGGGSAGSSATPAPVTRPTSSPAPGDDPAPGGRESLPPETGTHTVTFAIRGSARRTSVTYAMSGRRKQRMVVSPPWSRTFTVADGQSIDVNAHSSGSGELTCTVKVDGELVKRATSSGDSATVDCGDSLGF
ncbi:MAG: hypothetical protein ACRDP6_42425 [Actinoallomurus sp.]